MNEHDHEAHSEHDSGCGANAAPFVLGALTQEERAAFARHMQSCAICREEVAALEGVASALPAAAPQVSAPPELKHRVMSVVREDARRREHEVDAERRRSMVRAKTLQAHTAPRGRRFPPRSPAGLAAVALAAVSIVLAVVAFAPGGGASTRVIRAQVLLPRASASLSVSGGRAQLHIAGMPQAAPGRVYEVWAKRTGVPQPTDALFAPTASGSATVAVPGGVAGVREVLVTSEPLGGSRVPTRAPVIVARVS